MKHNASVNIEVTPGDSSEVSDYLEKVAKMLRNLNHFQHDGMVFLQAGEVGRITISPPKGGVDFDAVKVTSDQDHSDIISSSVSALNQAFVAAKDDGLKVQLEVETLSRFETGQVKVPVIKASVSRAFFSGGQEGALV